MDGLLVQEGEAWAVRFERRLRHPVEKVWRAISEPAELRQWFPDGGVEIDLTVGGKVRFAAEGWDEDDDLVPREGTVTELDPPRLLEFTWGDDPLRFELTPDGDGCVLVFSQRFEGKAAAPRLAAGWTICLGNLDALLDGTSAAPADWFPLYQQYAKELGDEPTVDGDGVVRVERVVPRPKADVAAALKDDGSTDYRLIEAGDRTIVLATSAGGDADQLKERIEQLARN
jgi:uncharacterized protein YndB with AHSA1/START domain